MDTNTLILYIIVGFLTLIIGSGGIFALIKFLQKNKVSDKEWEAQLRFCAFLLEAGVDIPNEILIQVMRRELTTIKFASSVKTFTKIDFIKFKKKKKYENMQKL